MYTHVCIYIYIEREREIERERDIDRYVYIYIYIHTHMCIQRPIESSDFPTKLDGPVSDSPKLRGPAEFSDLPSSVLRIPGYAL